MAEFSSLDNSGQTMPTSGASASSMSLTMPNSMITGTMAGLQQVGSPSLTVDSVKNLITVKPISTANTQILRYGQVATGFLGMAVNDGTNDTMFAGQDNTGATVVKIAKTGFDAKTASAANLLFNSSQDVLKVVQTGVSAISPGTINAESSITNTIAHNLGFSPAMLVYANAPNGSGGGFFGASGLTLLPAFFILSGGTVALYAQATVDTTNLYISLTNPSGVNINFTGFNWSFKYYILQESAATS